MGAPSFDTSRARFGDLIAGIGGLVLFISLFLDWYSVSVKTSLGTFGGISVGGSGWEALSFIDILLALIALIAMAVAVARIANVLPRGLPATPGLIVLIAGAIATLLVLFRIISIPHGDIPDVPGVNVDFGRSFGIFLALIAAIAVTVGGWLNWNEEGQPRPGAAGAGRGPLGAGQPGGGYGAAPQQQGYAQPPQQQQQPFATPPQPQQQQQQPAAAAAPAQQQPAAQQQAGQAKADWYPDPRGEKRLRYYDGTQWTEHTAD